MNEYRVMVGDGTVLRTNDKTLAMERWRVELTKNKQSTVTCEQLCWVRIARVDGESVAVTEARQ